MLDNLQGSGLLLCLGAVLLVIILFAFARRAFGSGSRAGSRSDEQVWQQRGSERPRYDSDEIESSGGIGRGPSTARTRDLDRDRNRDRIRDRDEEPRSSLGRERRREDRDDDDDVRSSGGFGGSG